MPEKYAYRYVKFVYQVVKILYPFTTFITWIARMAASMFGVSTSEKQDAVTEEEIISMVDEAHEQGVLQKDEAEMIQNIFAFNDTEAGSVMTHRTAVVAFSLDRSSEKRGQQNAGRGKFPVSCLRRGYGRYSGADPL